MEELIKELIVSVNNLGKFSWNGAISLFSLVAAWITIVFLLKDKLENGRPYLQISFELVKSNLACIVIKNVGNVPLEIKKIKFDEEFIKQLPKSDYEELSNNSINKLIMFPGQQWRLYLGVIIPEIIKRYKMTTLNIYYEYSKIGKNKRYKESTEIDFKQYYKMLVYISELDEIREENSKISKGVNEITIELRELKNKIGQCIKIESINKK